MPNVTKILLDGAGNPFNTVLWDDGTGNTNTLTQFVDNTPITTVPATAAGSALFVVDTTGYRGISFAIANINGSILSAEGSNDSVNWSTIPSLDTVTSGYTTTVGSNTRAYYIPATAKFVRLRVNSYNNGGAITCTAFLRQLNLDPSSLVIAGNVGVQGTTGHGSTDNGNPAKIGGFASTNAPAAVADGQRVNAWYTRNGAALISVTGNDGTQAGCSVANTDNEGATGRLRVRATLDTWSGTGFDRVRDANLAHGTTGTGVLAAGKMVFDGTNWRRQRGLADGTQVTTDLDGVAVPVGSFTGVGVLFSTLTNGYAGVSFQTSNSWNSSAINFEGSNDSTDGTNGTWVSINAQILNNSANGGTTQTSSASTGFFIPATMTWIRARISSYGSGGAAISGTAALRSYAPFTANSNTTSSLKAAWWGDIDNGSLIANQVFLGTVRDTGQANGGNYAHSRFAAYIDPGVASTGAIAILQGSNNNSLWTPYKPAVDISQPVPVQIESRIFFRYNRLMITNGATAQTGFFASTHLGD